MPCLKRFINLFLSPGVYLSNCPGVNFGTAGGKTGVVAAGG